MNKQPLPESRELLVWKYSECVDCEFASSCPKKVDNLRMCFGEDGLDTNRDVKALIKRTIRFICKARKNIRRHEHQENVRKRGSVWYGPKPLEAIMSCSDIEEFVACQKSG